jgi:DNA-binding response OmpR family regulator
VAQILLVEDDPVMAEGIRDVLELGGHAGSITSDGVEGLMALAQTRRDLIISDVKMPRMDGFKFYQAVRANPAWVFIPFIFLTARGQHEDVYCGMRMGADGYLLKPYDNNALVAIVESKLAHARAISEATADEMETLKRSVVSSVRARASHALDVDPGLRRAIALQRGQPHARRTADVAPEHQSRQRPASALESLGRRGADAHRQGHAVGDAHGHRLEDDALADAGARIVAEQAGQGAAVDRREDQALFALSEP